MDSMNRGESKVCSELVGLRAIGRKILRRIFKLFMVGRKETQMDSLTLVDNLAKNAMIVHDLFAQDDAAFEDALHIKTTVALFALIQNQCPIIEYDLCMESLAVRVGEFEQAILDRRVMFPDDPKQWCGKTLVDQILDRSPNLESFACLCAI